MLVRESLVRESLTLLATSLNGYQPCVVINPLVPLVLQTWQTLAVMHHFKVLPNCYHNLQSALFLGYDPPHGPHSFT
jgi:hypothetical protein